MKLMYILATGAALWFAGTSAGMADAAAGKEVFEAGGCGECHYTDGPAREKTIEDQMAKKGPELWYAGDKFQADWLRTWLADPEPIRLLQFGSLTEENPGGHAALAEAEAESVKEFLMSLTTGEVEAGSVKVKKNSKGRQIFTKKMPCSGCHQYPGRKNKVSGGLSGPSLVGAGQRLNPDWILAYLQKPDVFKPVKMMPVFVGVMKDKDMVNVASYIGNFKVPE